MQWIFMNRFLCRHVFSVLLSMFLGVELLSHMANLVWSFEELPDCYPVYHFSTPFCILSSNLWRFEFLHILNKHCLFSFSDYCRLRGCEVVFHHGFHLHFLEGLTFCFLRVQVCLRTLNLSSFNLVSYSWLPEEWKLFPEPWQHQLPDHPEKLGVHSGIFFRFFTTNTLLVALLWTLHISLYKSWNSSTS